MRSAYVIAVVLAFAISALLGPVVIPWLRKIKCGQKVREEGPETHLKKNGTPTMGGILILFSVMVTSSLFVKEYPDIIPVLFATFGFGLIGFLDDAIKVVCKRSMGLTSLQKLLGQLLMTGIFAFYMVNKSGVSLAMQIPFMQGQYIDLGKFTIPALFFIVLGTVNGANFTDGLDGLAGSVTAMIAIFFAVVAIGRGSGVAPMACAVVGALFGFLLFNVHPAEVFMGDTGSLALGGFVATCGYLLQMPVYIAIVGAVYLIEVLSVILQVAYFKISGGKRLLKMAPLHHHFELCGWSETGVVALFTIITAVLCLIGLMGL